MRITERKTRLKTKTLSLAFSSLKKNTPKQYFGVYGAENETRTRDPNLGKVMLYQLSYFRIFF